VTPEQHEELYVLCVRGTEKLIIDGSFRSRAAENVAAVLAPQDWQRLPAGQGSKALRWARVRLLRRRGTTGISTIAVVHIAM
jgi:hypothetical protein